MRIVTFLSVTITMNKKTRRSSYGISGVRGPISFNQFEDLHYDRKLYLSPIIFPLEELLSLDCLLFVIKLYRFGTKLIKFT